jgi:DNA mismatch repair protein MutL
MALPERREGVKAQDWASLDPPGESAYLDGMPVRQLSETTINRIAAGEVIERPASVVKELVENAIDAGASRIDIVTAGGGKTLIRVSDDGDGMTRADLELAVERHCTSKLDEDDLMAIVTLGFRGEALPSIGAVARLAIATRHASEPHGWQIAVEGGRRSGPDPVAFPKGSRVEVRDLFFATPARLKFLKTERAEAVAIADMVKRLALACPDIRFTLSGSDRSPLDLPAETGPDAFLKRAARVVGADFRDNAVAIDARRDDVRLLGHAGLPTYHRAQGNAIHVLVNGRPVRDKLLIGAVRAGYADVIDGDRHPVVVLDIRLDPALVDVNVHPAKADVRFRDAGLVRGLVVGALREAFARSGHRAASTGGAGLMAVLGRAAAQPSYPRSGYTAPGPVPRAAWDWRQSPFNTAPAETPAPSSSGFSELIQGALAGVALPSADARADAAEPASDSLDRPLGAARAQLHENFIVAQTSDGLVIVDAHAAHERITYEKLKRQRAETGIARQMLLVPEIVDLPAEDVARLLDAAPALAEAGLVLDGFGPEAVAVRETPALLGRFDVAGLVRDLADDLAEEGDARRLGEKLDAVLSRVACHGSVRTGRRLRPEEMDALLREMEVTPNAGQCNHGRPTYVELKLADIERLFGRR